MNLSEIKVGDEIEYTTLKNQTRKGVVKQVTGRLITVQGERYPDTILVNDLVSGQARILKLTGGEGENNVSKRLKKPSTEDLRQIWIEEETISNVAKRLDISPPTAKQWLIDTGVINSLGQPIAQTPPEPEQAANQEPAQGLEGSADTSIPNVSPYGVGKSGVPPTVMPLGCELPPRVSYTSSQYQGQVSQGCESEDKIIREELYQIHQKWQRQNTITELKERWAVDIVRQELPNDTKVELFAKLLEIEVA